MESTYKILSFAADLVGASPAKDVLRKGTLEHQFITEFYLRSEGIEHTIYQEVVFKIDWDNHELRVDFEHSTIAFSLDARSVPRAFQGLAGLLRHFDAFRREHALSLVYSFGTRQVKGIDVNELLGLAASRAYVGLEVAMPDSAELEELHVSLQAYEQPTEPPERMSRVEGEVVRVGRDYGILREGRTTRPDFWFKRSDWPGGVFSVGARATFMRDLRPDGVARALRIEPVSGEPGTAQHGCPASS